MKKSHVYFVMLSCALEDGSRKTLIRNEIASCKNRGDAELISYLLTPHYEKAYDFNREAKPGKHMYFLSVE